MFYCAVIEVPTLTDATKAGMLLERQGFKLIFAKVREHPGPAVLYDCPECEATVICGSNTRPLPSTAAPLVRRLVE